jgi:hypothetical protein
MRIVLFVLCAAGVVVSAARADAQALPSPLIIGAAWPAPVGHFQPRAGDIPTASPLSPSQAGQEKLDHEIDEKLKICRGC